MEIEELNFKKIQFLNSLSKTNEEIKILEESTKNQSECDLWKIKRRLRLTSSNFGKVCKLRASTSRKNIVKNILYNNFSVNLATNYGIEIELLAKATFEQKTLFQILPAGLFIDKTYNFLAASPDRLLENNRIVEIKCPFTIKEMTPKDAVKMGK